MESESNEETRHYSREELQGLESTLRDLFNPKFWKREKGFDRHLKDVLGANTFLEEVFVILNEKTNWENMLTSVPGRIEVAFLRAVGRNKNSFLATPDALLTRTLDKEERTFLETPDRLWTLFISLPRGCIQELDQEKKLLWGAEMPCRFYFGESRTETEKYGAPQYELLGVEYPYR